eukprot:10181980-Alexandrium_andersonii.AAC.1
MRVQAHLWAYVNVHARMHPRTCALSDGESQRCVCVVPLPESHSVIGCPSRIMEVSPHISDMMALEPDALRPAICPAVDRIGS